MIAPHGTAKDSGLKILGGKILATFISSYLFNRHGATRSFLFLFFRISNMGLSSFISILQ